jgi:hypothetical protein
LSSLLLLVNELQNPAYVVNSTILKESLYSDVGAFLFANWILIPITLINSQRAGLKGLHASLLILTRMLYGCSLLENAGAYSPE